MIVQENCRHLATAVEAGPEVTSTSHHTTTVGQHAENVVERHQRQMHRCHVLKRLHEAVNQGPRHIEGHVERRRSSYPMPSGLNVRPQTPGPCNRRNGQSRKDQQGNQSVRQAAGILVLWPLTLDPQQAWHEG